MRTRYERFEILNNNDGLRIILKQRGNILGVNLFFIVFMIIGVALYLNESLRRGFTYGLFSFLILEFFCLICIGFGVYAWFYKFECLITKEGLKFESGFMSMKKKEILLLSEIKKVSAVTYQGEKGRKKLNIASSSFPYRIEILKTNGEIKSTGFDFRNKENAQAFIYLLKIYLDKPIEYFEKDKNI